MYIFIVTFTKNNYKRLFYRIKNVVEVATLCHYDIRLLNENTVESIALLERVSNRKADAKVHIDVDLEDYYRIKDAQGKDGK